jgi:uncharacterized protein (TIGR02265 family)
MDTIPTIKGIFVNSHIRQFQQERGEGGIEDLKKRYGKSIEFRNDDDIPVSEEVKILECIVDILHTDQLSPEDRSYQAGVLHFKNFMNTPFAKIIFSLFSKNFKMLMLQSKNIAGHVFKGVHFDSKDLGGNGVEVIMKNNDYPLEHFIGLFQAWMDFSGLHGKVTGEKVEDTYVYTMHWE